MKYPRWINDNRVVLCNIGNNPHFLKFAINEKHPDKCMGIHVLEAHFANATPLILEESSSQKYLEGLRNDLTQYYNDVYWNNPADTENDPVNHPKHYTTGKIEVADFINDQKLNFFEGNVVKYVARHKHKNGLEDLKKAKWYLEYLIKEGDKQCQPTQGNSSKT